MTFQLMRKSVGFGSSSTDSVIKSLNQQIERRHRRDPVLVQHQVFPWRESVIQRLEEITGLPFGWNGYDGIAVSYSNASFAEQVIAAVCSECSAAPQITPGDRGDLQIEWHTESGDVELHVLGPYVVDAWFENVQTGELDECRLSTDFSKVSGWLFQISEAINEQRAA